MLRVYFLLTLTIHTFAQDANYRLPDEVKPINYNVLINTDFIEFNGDVTITIVASEPTNTITLHSKDLTVSNIRLLGSSILVTDFDHVNETDFLVITLSNELVRNQSYFLAMDFSGALGTKNAGFYRAVYNDADNLPRVLATTQFGLTDARRAFPCFDEPSFKATFRIRLVKDVALITTSNMQMESSLPWALDTTKVVDTYTITPVMSTYLIAFTLSDYGRVFDGTHSVYGRKHLLDRGDGDYALRIGKEAIDAMALYTSVDFTLLKMDQVAIPNDYYYFSAMENWGMVTYRERNLMYNEQGSTAAEKQKVATIVAHEFAHQWFGNLVTPLWWNYAWLNEGFATYFEVFVTDLLESDWQMKEQFITSVMQPAFDVDCFESTTPMTKNESTETPSEVLAVFDTIIYEKAASVIRMAADFLGEDVFKAGLTDYLQTWSFDNVEPAQLYNSWQLAPNNAVVDIADIIGTWETQKGFPVVTVTRNYNDENISVTQARFLLSLNSTDSTKWIIPFNWFGSNVNVKPHMLLPQHVDLHVNSQVPAEDWLMVNHERKGYYRVNYDDTNWKLITDALMANITKFPVANRAQVIDDSFNLARAGLLGYYIALDLGKYLVNEVDYVPIATFTNVLNYLKQITTATSFNSYIKSYGINILERIYNRTGFDILPADSHLLKLTKVSVMTWLCNLGFDECRTKSLETFLAWIEEGVAVQPDAQSFVYCNALKQSGSPVHWAHLYTRYQQSREDTQRSRIATALGCISDESFLKLSLEFLILETPVFSATDRVGVITSIYSNNEELGVEIVLDFLTKNYQAAEQRIGSISRIVNDLASRITTENLLSQFNTFAETNAEHFSESFNETIASAILAAEYNLQWIETMSPRLQDYFFEVTPSAGATLASQVFIVVSCMVVWLIC